MNIALTMLYNEHDIHNKTRRIKCDISQQKLLQKSPSLLLFKAHTSSMIVDRITKLVQFSLPYKEPLASDVSLFGRLRSPVDDLLECGSKWIVVVVRMDMVGWTSFGIR